MIVQGRTLNEVILVTGGAGFIGSHVTRTLLRDGYDVVVIDISGRPYRLSDVSSSIEYVRLDIRSETGIYRVMEKYRPMGIIHLAAVSRVVWCEKHPIRCIDVNINGTISLAKALARLSYKPFIIYGSSREVYGEPRSLPATEHCPKIPVNLYGYTKLVGERIVEEAAKNMGVQAIILRFSNVYGSEYDILDRVIPRFIIRAIKGLPLEIHGGDQMFDFTHIDDTVEGVRRAIEKIMEAREEGYCRDYHILTGTPTRITDLPKMISEAIGGDVRVVYTRSRSYDVRRFYGDPGRAYRELGFRARIGIREGIVRTVERFREVFE